MASLSKHTPGLFNHDHDHVFTGYQGADPYLYYKPAAPSQHGVIDGINRQHVSLYGKCDICGKEIRVAMMHVNADSTLYDKSK